MASWATVLGPGDKKHYFQDSDVEWATKAVYHETAHEDEYRLEWEAILWVMVNRWVSGRYGRDGQSWGEYIRSFSQPVNPYWATRCTGDERNRGVCEEAMARRTMIQNRSFSWYQENASKFVSLVTSFMRGEISNKFPGWANFDDGTNQYGLEKVTFPSIVSANEFYYQEWSKDWTVNTVRIVGTGGGRSPLGVLLALGFIGFVIASNIDWRK